MLRPAIMAAVLAIALTSGALAQSGTPTAPPARGTPQRTAILNAVRPSVASQLGAPIEFMVHCLQVDNGWALATLEPQRPGGRAIDRRTITDWQNRDGLTVTALLRFRSGRWQLVDSVIGATDVWYQGTAPQALIQSRCY